MIELDGLGPDSAGLGGIWQETAGRLAGNLAESGRPRARGLTLCAASAGFRPVPCLVFVPALPVIPVVRLALACVSPWSPGCFVVVSGLVSV